MQVTISIDKEVFDSDEVGGTIKAIFNSIPEEEKVAVVKDLMMQYLTEESVIKNYFVGTTYNRWSSNPEYYPSIEFRSLIGKIDLTTEMEEVKAKMMTIINDNFTNILTELFVSNFVGKLSETLVNNTDFRNNLTYIINSKLQQNNG